MIELNLNPSSKELRQFAGIWWPLFSVLMGALIWRWWGVVPAVTVGGIGIAMGLLGLLQPAWIRPLFVGWMVAAFPIGWTISHLLMLAIYYGLFTPLGLFMRLIRFDPMARQIDTRAATYWTKSSANRSTQGYFRQY